MEAQVQERRLGSLDAIRMVQVLHDVRKRLERKGYRPVLSNDKLNSRQTLLRVEVYQYYTYSTVNTPLDKATGVRFVPLRKAHLTPEGLERIRRVDYDLVNPENNEIRWFTKIEGQAR